MEGVIYIIRNKINNKIYVGQTLDFKQRIRAHKSRFKKKTYQEFSRIYKAMAKYGLENFEIKPIETCDSGLLNEREIYWINYFDSYNNGYNATKGGNNPIAYWKGKKRDKDTNKKISEKLVGISWGRHREDTKNQLKIAKIGNKNGNKKVVCIELDLVFESIKIAAEFIGVNPSCVTGVLKGRRKTTGGYHWRYFDSQETIPNGSTLEVELPVEAQGNLVS